MRTVSVPCAQCGEVFERAVGVQGRPSAACSPECRRLHRNAQTAAIIAAHGREGDWPPGAAEPAASLCLECASWTRHGCRRGAFSVCQPNGPARYYDAKEVFA